MVRHLRLTLAYEGTDFGGWQRQPGIRTVQAIVEDALAILAGEAVTVIAAGRTDSGVHAAAQVASVRFRSERPVEELHRALNATLPRDVRVLAIDEVPSGFDARHHARFKTYRYSIWNARSVPPLARDLVWHVPAPLDLAAMQEAAVALLGEHDFAAFRSAGGSVRTSVRKLISSSWSEVHWRTDPLSIFAYAAEEARLLRYEVTGTGFLRHMVRSLVGTLVEVGRHRLRSADVGRILTSRDRRQAGETAPPHGLTLWRVDYD